MDFEMDELNKRRQQRLARQQQRLQQQRQLLIRLAVAVAILVVVGTLIFVLTRTRKPAPEQPQQTQQTQQATTETAAPTEEAGNRSVIRFAAAGDLNITDNVVNSGGQMFDYTQTFMDVVPILARADLTAINFEGNLFGFPYGTQNASAPSQMMTALLNAGVDLVQVANSYTIHNGYSGLISTIQGIRSAGLETMGAYTDTNDFEKTGGYTIRKINGIKVAVVAFTKGMDGMALPAGSENCVNLLYTDYSTAYSKINTQGITKILRAVAKEKPDITIAMLHWGSEYNDNHSDSQKKIRNLMLSEGVDAIIGTHPHYVQEIEYDQEANTLVAYSLGDFFGDGTRTGTDYSIVLELEITKDLDTGETRITGYQYTPVFTVSDEPALRVVRMEEAMRAYEAGHLGRVSRETYEAMQYAKERIAVRVVPPQPEEDD